MRLRLKLRLDGGEVEDGKDEEEEPGGACGGDEYMPLELLEVDMVGTVRGRVSGITAPLFWRTLEGEDWVLVMEVLFRVNLLGVYIGIGDRAILA